MVDSLPISRDLLRYQYEMVAELGLAPAASPNPEARPDGLLCRWAPALILEPRQRHTARSVASRVLTGPVVMVDGLAVKIHVLRGREAVKKDFSHPGPAHSDVDREGRSSR